METIYIYTLSDPRDGTIRYVGQAKDPKQRLASHSRAEGTAKSEWIKSLREQHLRPILTVIESCPELSSGSREKHWIEKLTADGHALFNNLHMPRTKVIAPTSYDSASLPFVETDDQKIQHPVSAEILSASQAATRLGVTKGWVHRLVQEGRLPAIKRNTPFGDYWEIDAADLDKVRGLKHTGRPPKKLPRT